MSQYPPNFSRAEMLVSNTAVRHGIPNEPTTPAIEANIIATAWKLQALRNKLYEVYGKVMPIRVLSVYRSPKVNKLVGGSRTSAHMYGMAADIIVPGLSIKELAEFAKQHVEGYDQIISEFNAWVHIGFATKPRKQLLTAFKQDGKTVYKNGIA